MKKIIVLIALVLIVIVGSFILLTGREQSGLLVLDSRTEGVSITIDDQPLLANGLSQHKLKAGAHELVASKTDYQRFSTNFTLKAGETKKITIQLEPLASDELVYKVLGDNNFTVTNDRYFYDNTWLVATITLLTDGNLNGSTVVLHKTARGWQLVFNGTSRSDDLKTLFPTDVYNYVVNQ